MIGKKQQCKLSLLINQSTIKNYGIDQNVVAHIGAASRYDSLLTPIGKNKKLDAWIVQK